MICPQYKQYELGQIDTRQFEAHLTECSDCQHQIQADKLFLKQFKQLSGPIVNPELWERIASDLHQEQKRRKRRSFNIYTGRYTPILKIAAVLLLIISISTVLFFRIYRTPPRLLTNSALQNASQKQAEYELAISELEKIGQEHLPNFDLELQLLYREQLAVIDAQIERCKSALTTNPANAHIRRYLMTALQDKQQTLEEIIRQRKS